MSPRVTGWHMHEFFSSAVTLTSNCATAIHAATRTKKLFFVDDLSAAEANGHTEGKYTMSL